MRAETLLYASLDLHIETVERKRKEKSIVYCRTRTGFDGRTDRQERTDVGARHNTVSLLCQTGLDR